MMGDSNIETEIKFAEPLEVSNKKSLHHRRMTQQEELLNNKPPPPVVYISKTGYATEAPNHATLAGGKSKIRENKVFSNKVYVPWYRRYYDVIPEGDRCTKQPFFGVIEEGFQDMKKQNLLKNKLNPRRSSVEEKELEITKKRLQAIHSKETAIIGPITNYLSWVRRKRMKQREDYESYRGRWLKFFSPQAKAKIKLLSHARRRARARSRFIKVITAVVCLNRFLKSMKEIHFCSDITLGEISANAESTTINPVKQGMFDPYKYKVINKMDEGSTIPFNIKMILTKPWYTRKISEIEQVVEMLYSMFIFVRYPQNVAKQMARVAWYSRIAKQRPILRQSDEAQCFCFLLSGIVKIFSMSQDSNGCNIEVVHRKAIRGELFGEDELSHLHAFRKVSATSLVNCELMTIDYNDYQASLMMPLGPTIIPMHIKIVKRNSLLKKIPLFDILDNAAEFLPCMYFPSEFVMVESLKCSDYIFLVLQGECYSASLPIIKPKPEEIRYLGERQDFTELLLQSSTGGDDGYFTRTMDLLRSGQSKEAFDRDRRLSSMRKDKKEFEEDIMRLCGVSLFKPKEELIKEIRAKRILGYYSSPDSAAFERGVCEDIIKKMRKYEEGNLDYKRDIDRIRNKCEKVNRVLERIAKAENGGNRHVMWTDRESNDSSCDSKTDERESLNTDDGADDTQDEGNGILSDESSREEDIMNEATSDQDNTSSHVHFREDDVTGKPGESQSSVKVNNQSGLSTIERSNEGSPMNSYIVSTKSSSSTTRHSKIRDGDLDPVEMYQNLEPKSEKSQSFLKDKQEEVDESMLPHSMNTPQLLNNLEDVKLPKRVNKLKGMKTKKQQNTKPTMVDSNPDYQESFEETSRVQGQNVIRYKTVATHRKYQLIGEHYLDFNDGKFRYQTRDLALISGGVEVVMIAKWFLLNHLYQHW